MAILRRTVDGSPRVHLISTWAVYQFLMACTLCTATGPNPKQKLEQEKCHQPSSLFQICSHFNSKTRL